MGRPGRMRRTGRSGLGRGWLGEQRDLLVVVRGLCSALGTRRGRPGASRTTTSRSAGMSPAAVRVRRTRAPPSSISLTPVGPASRSARSATTAGASQAICAANGPAVGQWAKWAAPLRISRSRARVIATYGDPLLLGQGRPPLAGAQLGVGERVGRPGASRASAGAGRPARRRSGSAARRSAARGRGRRQQTTGNSRPLAAWTVIRRTASVSASWACCSRLDPSRPAASRSAKPRRSRPSRASNSRARRSSLRRLARPSAARRPTSARSR